MTQSSRRGSILIYAFLMVVTIGLLAAGMTTIVQQRLSNQARESLYVARGVDVDSAKALVAASSFRAYSELSPGNFTSYLSDLNTAVDPLLSEVTFVAPFSPSGNPFDRNSIYGPLPPENPTNAFLRTNHARVFRFGTTAVFSGPKAGLQSGIVGAFAEDVDVEIYEMPTANFQLVCFASPFMGSATSNISVIGRNLFTHGIDPSGNLASFSASDFSISMGDATGALPAHNFAQVGRSGAISWGGMSGADFFADTGIGIVARQSFLLENPTDTRTISWIDPAIAPLDLPEGIRFDLFDGASRLIIDLAVIAAESRFRIDCTAATADLGLVIEGTETSSLGTVSIVTNCKILLSGSNVRPALIASNYAGNHAVFSEDFIEGSSGLPAEDTFFRGYFFLNQENLAFDVRESWNASIFRILGSLVFQGGSLSGPNRIQIEEDPDFINSLANGAIRCDRFAYLNF